VSHVPGVIVVNVRGRSVTATRERVKTPPEEPPPALTTYWVITVDGMRYLGWPAHPGETESSVMASLRQWIDEN
jgi:hypothetical protein